MSPAGMIGAACVSGKSVCLDDEVRSGLGTAGVLGRPRVGGSLRWDPVSSYLGWHHRSCGPISTMLRPPPPVPSRLGRRQQGQVTALLKLLLLPVSLIFYVIVFPTILNFDFQPHLLPVA